VKFILAIVLFGCGYLELAWSKTPEEIFQFAAPSIVIVEARDGSNEQGMTGSGVAVDVGQVVTNCHVVKQLTRISVRQGSVSYPASLQYEDAGKDLCQLSVPNLNAPPAIIGSVDKLKIGERVVAIGAPQGLELTISEGLVSSVREIAPGFQVIQTSAPISRGSSGGGLFNEEGLLIGITTAFLEGGQNLNFALPASLIPDLAKSSVDHSATQQSEGTTAAQAKALEEVRQLGESLKATDPQFAAKIELLTPIITDIVASGIPPNEWRERIEKAYWALSKSDAFDWAQKAVSLVESQQWEELIEHGRRWARSDPDNAAAWYVIGQGYDGISGKYRYVAEYYLRNAQDAPDYRLQEMYMNMHDAEIAKSKTETYNAMDAYQRAVQLNPKFAQAWFRLGFAGLKTDNSNIAVQAYKVLQTLDANMAERLLAAIGVG
jgi:S1-C subfamily serine protease